MAQMGHTTANLTLAIYARQMDRRDGELERLKALVVGREWTALDGSNQNRRRRQFSGGCPGPRKPCKGAGLEVVEPTGIEPVTSSLQSTFAEALQEARKRRESREDAPREGPPDEPRLGWISGD